MSAMERTMKKEILLNTYIGDQLKAVEEKDHSNDLLSGILSDIPNNWLDPLLTGPNAVIGQPPYNCQDIERLFIALKLRIRSRIEAKEGV